MFLGEPKLDIPFHLQALPVIAAVCMVRFTSNLDMNASHYRWCRLDMTVAQPPWTHIRLDTIMAKSTVPQGSLSTVTIVEYHTLAFKVLVF
jgi:hypothetical protein